MKNACSYDWGAVDWSKQDTVIAAELGSSREGVRQARVRIGGGKAETPRQRTGKTAEDRLAELDTEGMTLPQLAKLVGCKERRVAVILNGSGKGYKRRPRGGAIYDWGKFPADWASMTDKELAMIVGADNPAVVAQWRNRHGYRKQVTAAKKVVIQ